MATLVSLAGALFVPFAIGGLVVARALRPATGLADGWPLRIALAAGLGLGVTAATTFLAAAFLGRIGVTFELGLLGLLAWRHRRAIGPGPAPAEDRSPGSWLTAGVAAVLAGMLLFDAAAFANSCLHSPQGGWDAWAFWNMRARFFFRAGEEWPRMYTSVLHWAQPTYPPLLPSAVSRLYLHLGEELPSAAIAIAAIFSASVLALLYATVRVLRGRTPALVATLVLAATPFFVGHSGAFYADIPLSFFFLATAALLALHEDDPGGRAGLLGLAGLAGGLAAFTKNEGMLFLLSILGARTVAVWASRGLRASLRELGRIAAGAAAPLAVLAVFKTGWAASPPIGDFYRGPISGLPAHLWANASDPERWSALASLWPVELFTFDGWPVPLALVLAGYAIAMGLDPDRTRVTTRTTAGALVLHLAGVSLVLLTYSALPMPRHMDALNRLLLQVLPTAILAVFSSVRPPIARAA